MGDTLLLYSDDASMLAQEVSERMNEFVGTQEKDQVLTVFDKMSYQSETGAELSISGLVEAIATPPLFGGHRVIVARDLATFGKKKGEFKSLIDALQIPADEVSLLLVWELPDGRTRQDAKPPGFLLDAVEARNGKVVGLSGKANTGRIKELIKEESSKMQLDLTDESVAAMAGWVGEEQSKIAPLLEILSSTFRKMETIELTDLDPFLGSDAGKIPIWDLGDAIDRSDRQKAVTVARRLMGNEVHPLVIMSYLHKQYERLLQLDDGITPKFAPDVIKILKLPGKQQFLAQQIAERYNNLGEARIRQAIVFLAEADLDLRGSSGLSSECIVEVLVARLASLSRWKA